jgi:hypothetical protein
MNYDFIICHDTQILLHYMAAACVCARVPNEEYLVAITEINVIFYSARMRVCVPLETLPACPHLVIAEAFSHY